jgi:deoxyhypusine synthase
MQKLKEKDISHEFMYKMILSGVLEQYYEIPRENSWMIAAAEANLPIVVPGWEDSTMGNIFASYCIKGELKATTMKSGIEYMTYLADWYTKNSGGKGGILPDRWRYRRRFPYLCSTNVISGYGNA